MKFSYLIISIALVCSLFTPINVLAAQEKLQPPSTASDYTQKVDAIIKKAHQLVGFNGSVLIAKPSGIVYQSAYGFADHNQKIKLTPQHQLSTGSISKEFSTIALMMLEEQGKINYYDKISTYLPNLPTWGNKITIEQLLSHTSGLPQISWRYNLDTQEVKKQLMAIDTLEFEPGTDYRYGNLNVLLRAFIIENVTKQSFTSFLQEKLFQPAGMKNTYNKTDLKDVRSSVVVGDYTSAILGVSFFTTPFDLYLWEKALMSHQFINSASMKKALTPHVLSGMSSRAYFDLGNFFKNDKNEITLLLHDGSNPDHHAIKANHLNKGLIFILMSSDGRKATLFELNNYISNLAQYRNNKIPASWWLANEINLTDFATAFKRFKAVVKQNKSLIINESSLNKLGYSFARKKELGHGIEIMKLNTELYPKSANTYDSYAELLIKNNQHQTALPVIQQGLKLAHDDKNNDLIKSLRGLLVKVNM
jgi:CubicO group peptidase (beta-lactamase class C family)